MRKILLVEDDPAIRMAIVDDFTFEGYGIDAATTGPEGLRMGLSGGYDIILLDLMLPGGVDGLDICKELRRRDIQTPVIMLTAKSQDYDKVIGLELGADDYVTKPYSPQELRSRVKAVLRRTRQESKRESKPVLVKGPLLMDVGKHECKLGDKALIMSALELDIVQILMENTGQVVTRDEVLDTVWGPDVVVSPRTIDTHIGNLRKKICTADYPGNSILSIRGLGYKLILEDS
jgi:two-component system alkaline phosphatase synthesis response regulator PhoP